MGPYFSRTSTVIRSAWVSPALTLKPPCLLDMLQASADRAVTEARLTMTDVLELGLAWMVRRYDVRLVRPMMDRDKVDISTWYRPLRDLYSIRGYSLTSDGVELGQANSSWILVNFESRKPQRLSRHLPPIYFDGLRADGPTDFEPLAPIERVDNECQLAVRLCDLDMNGHVNNVHYMEWMTEGVPAGIFGSCGLVGLKIEFLHEVAHGQRVTVRSQSDGLAFRHELANDDGLVVCRGETVWRSLVEGESA